MDLNVYGELLTHHRRGHGVDGEAFRVRIPPPVGQQDMPQMGSCGDRSLRRRKSTFDDLLICFGIFREYIGATPRLGDTQGAHKPGWRGLPPGRGVGACGAPGAPLPWLPSSPIFFRSRKIFSGIFFRLDSVSKSPLKGVKNMEKTGTGAWY